MIVLVTLKGWTGPKMVDGKQVEGTFRAHQVPFSDMTDEHIRLLEEWMRSYKPEELFDEAGALRPELAELAPKGTRRMGDNPHANGGLLLHDLELPDFRDFAVDVPDARGRHGRIHQDHGRVPRRDHAPQSGGEELPGLRSRRDPQQPPGRRPGGHAAHLGSDHRALGRPAVARPAGSWRS